MKYSGHIDIDKPIALVTAFFADDTNLKEWQDGFVRKELQRGTPGEQGAISKMFYKVGERDMILTETIVANLLPDYFEASYHHEHMDNTMTCKFLPLGENRTRYEYTFVYTRISWFMPKILALLFPGMYRKQGEKWMKQFKASVENL